MISALPQIPSYAQGVARRRGDSADPELRDGLVGLWVPPLGPTGLSLYDWSGYGNHGTLTNMDPAAVWVATEKGWALDLDGSEDTVHCGNGTSLDLVDQVTMAAWFNTSDTKNQWILAKYEKVGSDEYGYEIYIYNNNIYVFIRNGGYHYTYTPITVGGKWWHVAGTFDGSKIRLYLDGRELASSSYTGSIGTTTNNLYLGTRTGNNYHFNGRIANAQIYSRALGPNEVATLYADPFALLWLRRPAVPLILAVGGPYRVATAQTFHTGGAAGQTFNAGQTAGQIDGRCG